MTTQRGQTTCHELMSRFIRDIHTSSSLLVVLRDSGLHDGVPIADGQKPTLSQAESDCLSGIFHV
jgi:hypothetical protein